MFDTPFWICCVILSKETLASVRIMNHVHRSDKENIIIPTEKLDWKNECAVGCSRVSLFDVALENSL
jgi:hypothetical protein